MLTIYGSPKSSSGRCFWCLEEIASEYKVESINFKEKQHQSAEFLKINPNGKIPVLIDGDYKIWESMAINFYLAEAYKKELLGETAKDRGLVYQWSIWSIAELQPPLVSVFIQLIFVPEERRDSKVIEKALSKLPSLLKTLDDGLASNQYLAGAQFSLADLNVASVVSICDSIKHDLKDYKNIQKWLENIIAKRPSYIRYQQLCK